MPVACVLSEAKMGGEGEDGGGRMREDEPKSTVIWLMAV